MLFRRARWYAGSTGQSYQAPLPEAYAGQGHDGPRLRALALHLYDQGLMSEPKILGVLRSVSIAISAAQLSTLLIAQPVFAAEYADIARAGLASSVSQQTTRARG